MDLFDRFAGAESWHTRRLLERARDLTDEQLDRPIKAQPQVLCWEQPEKSLRELLTRIVYTKEVWTAALTGGDFPDDSDNTIDGLLARFNAVEGRFDGVMREVRDEGRWDDTFVDALCEEPETFTYGGVFGHLITFNSHRRLVALDVMRQYGVNDLGYGDPIEWERAMGVGVGIG